MSGDLSERDDASTGSSSEEERSHAPDQKLLTHRYRLWIHGSNLPRQGRGILGRIPSTYAVVTGSALARGSKCNGDHTLGMTSPGVHLGETEVVDNNCNPQFTKAIPLDYEYGSKYYFFVHVFLCEKSNGRQQPDHASRKSKTLLGTARFEVGDIIGTAHHSRARRLRQGGVVFCSLEPRGMNGSTEFSRSMISLINQEEDPAKYLRFRLSARNLVTKHQRRYSLITGGDPDTIVTVSKRPEKTNRKAWVEIYRSQPILNTRDPKWDVALVDLDCLCNNDIHQPIRLSVLAVRSHRSPSLIGNCETTVHYIMHAAKYHRANEDNAALVEHSCGEGSEFILQRESQKLREAGRLQVLDADLVTMDERSGALREVLCREQQAESVGRLDLAQIPVMRPPDGAQPPVGGQIPWAGADEQRTFRNLLVEGGCKLNFCVAIDFTSSNGDARSESSLHYQSECLNDYEETIMAVGHAMDRYSRNQSYSVWGFGAKFADGVVRHLFQLGADKFVNGVDGILDAYRSIFYSGFTMSGPTVFLYVIQRAAVQAKAQHDQMTKKNTNYTVLLVVTDGIMTDVDETLRKIRAYRGLPLSIIFVGVGRSDFSKLRNLCQDCPENTTFVEFRSKETPSDFAVSALKNLPRQISSYMSGQNF